MHSGAPLIRSARNEAGFTQAELARRLATTQSAVARLESAGSNPRLATIERALQACGKMLELRAVAPSPSVDESLLARQLRLRPGERLTTFERSYASARKIALAGRAARGELA